MGTDPKAQVPSQELRVPGGADGSSKRNSITELNTVILFYLWEQNSQERRMIELLQLLTNLNRLISALSLVLGSFLAFW